MHPIIGPLAYFIPLYYSGTSLPKTMKYISKQFDMEVCSSQILCQLPSRYLLASQTSQLRPAHSLTTGRSLVHQELEVPSLGADEPAVGAPESAAVDGAPSQVCGDFVLSAPGPNLPQIPPPVPITTFLKFWYLRQ